MSKKKRFLLRLDERMYEALAQWAADEFRSVNGQIEYLLRDALRRAGRLPKHGAGDGAAGADGAGGARDGLGEGPAEQPGDGTGG